MIPQISFRFWQQERFSAIKWQKLGKHPLIKLSILTCCVLFLELLILKQPTSWFVNRPHQIKLPESLFFSVSLSQPVSFQSSEDSPIGRPLSDLEVETIRQLIPNAPKIEKFPAFEQVPLFILHDTAGLLAKSTVYEQQKQNQGPLGNGIAAYIARDGDPIVTRGEFWELRRPSALAYEKALDVVPEKERNQILRQIYQLTSDSAKNLAFLEVTEGLTVNRENLIKGGKIWLNTRSEGEFTSISRRYPNRLDGAKSTGIWAMTQVCHDVLDGVNLARYPHQKENLGKKCQIVYPALKASRQRIAAAVNVEIVQHMGSHCFLSDEQVRIYNNYVDKSGKIPENRVVSLLKDDYQAYPDSQYEGLVLVYLYSALQAGVFPEVTTHFLLDKEIGDHCDPRGLDVNYFYEKIAQRLGHPLGTMYGIIPQYGINLKAGDNVWWAESVLGMKP